MHSRHVKALLVLVACGPVVARAEVMDKVTPPWAPPLLLLTAGVTGVCMLLAWRPGWLRTALALLLSGVWLALRSADDIYTSDVGPAIRAEFSAAEASTWLWMATAQVVLPLLVTAGLLLARRYRRVAV